MRAARGRRCPSLHAEKLFEGIENYNCIASRKNKI
jgi:hypothetical protein